MVDPKSPNYKPAYIRILERDDHIVGEATAFPPLTTQAGNLAGAVGRVVKAAVTGEPIRVSPEEHEKRHGVCMACDQLVNNRCKLCGCRFLTKIELATERCPIGKWERVEGDSK